MPAFSFSKTASMKCRFTVLGLILTLGLAPNRLKGQAPATAPKTPTRGSSTAKSGEAVVPFEMLPTNHMLVRARINGKGPYLLIFDLGAPITLLGNAASEATGVVKTGAPRPLLFAMPAETTVDKIEVGNLTTTKLPVIVFDHPLLTALGRMTGRSIDGIMGFTFFARYKTTIDYQARRMTFEPVDYVMRDLLKELPDRLLGPKVARRRVLAPSAMVGLRLGKPDSGLSAPGVPIIEVYKDSPAERAGLKTGDVLVSLDGRWTTSIADVFDAAAGIKAGQTTSVVILRNGQEKTLIIRPVDGA